VNKIRLHFAQEVEELLPVLHETYRLIGRYQGNRNRRNQQALEQQLLVMGEHLQFFKPLLQGAKRPYFDAILVESLPISDRIIALDTAVGMMHIEFAMARAYQHTESESLRRVLEQSRHMEIEDAMPMRKPQQDVLTQGLPASPGFVSGKAVIVKRPSEYRRIPGGSIVVARMTRPELIQAADRVTGIVTDIGGSVCHAAILARELGIPCVVGAQDATETIRPRSIISVNGTTGIVKLVRP